MLDRGCFGDNSWSEGFSLAVDSSGNSYVVGQVRGPATFVSTTLPEDRWYVFMSKSDPSGTLLWGKVLPREARIYSYLWRTGRDVALDHEGYLYLTGYVDESAVTLGSNTLDADKIFVAKLDPTGNFVAATCGGGGAPRAIALDRSGNSYIAGVFVGTATFGSRRLVGSANKQTMFLWKVWLQR